MSRRSRNARERRRSRSQAYHRGGSYPPQSPPPAWTMAPLPESTLYLRTRTPRARPSVFASRTVRPPLMRTVSRDTHSRVFNNRPSPDLPNRAAARMSSWTTFNQIPLQRAVTCARRSIRREVLFALGRGNGAGSRGVPKSKEKCS